MAHEAPEVTLEHGSVMEEATLDEEHAASIAIDWATFFDSIDRTIGTELMRERTRCEGTTETAVGYVDAEERLTAQARYRYKVGGCVEEQSTTRESGFYQGPNWSIQIALSLMAAWTELITLEAECSTAGFVDDSSMNKKSKFIDEVQRCLRKAWTLSLEFGELSGCEMNPLKTKATANSPALEAALEETFADI